MSRYVAIRPVTPDEHWDKGPGLPSLTVDGERRVDTGLVDRFGCPIMRLPDPVGFEMPKGR